MCVLLQAAVPDHIKSAVERSASAAQLRAAHEAAVGGDKAPDASLLAAYMAYIQVGMRSCRLGQSHQHASCQPCAFEVAAAWTENNKRQG